MYSSFTHVDNDGKASMVDVGNKQVTSRKAAAEGLIKFSSAEVLPLLRSNQMKKGDVLAVARVAGIMAAKQTHNLIPLCHALTITKVGVDFEVRDQENAVYATCEVKCRGQTGVEMEALIGVTIALNTVYDMCKAVDRHMVLSDIKVIEKQGGKHDFDLAPQAPQQ